MAELREPGGTTTVAPSADGGETSSEEVRDQPEAYIARDRRHALADRIEMADRVRGSALFADISGFTPLTEALANELGSQRGSEELTANLDRVFHAVIAELDRYGGDVIYFSGDAITCWLDGDDGLRATAAALAIQEAMDRAGMIVTPNGTIVRLAVKVAVAVGAARRFVVGDPTIQLIDVLAGRLVDDLAETEHHAEKGEVVLDPSAVRSLGDRVHLREIRTDPGAHGDFGVVESLAVEVADQPADEPPPLEDELVRPWLLPAVWDRIRTGRGEFLGELRPAYPVFLRFGGIDYDDDDEAIAKLDAFVQRAQQIMAGYGGNVLQLTLGDKGAYLYGVFGAPTAHEDDAARAAAAALELRDLEHASDATGIQIGIGHGRLRSGTYGHRMRRTFVCLGDAVNLAARLMSKAPEGAIYVSDDVRTEAGDAYIWEALPDLTLKGKAAPVVAHALTGSLERASRRKLRFELPLIGRTAELQQLENALADASAGNGRVFAIAAEAGMGKSRLVAEFVRSVRRRGVFVGFGECQSFGSNSAYLVWREIWRRLLRLDDDASDAAQLEQVEAEIAGVDPNLVARAPLLGGLLGLDIPDNDLTAAFDAKLRKTSLEDLLGELLRGRATTEPIVIVLEDCHWIDELSRDLLESLARTAASLSILIVLAYRPAASVGGGLGLERLPSFAESTLDHLGREEASDLIRSKLHQVVDEETEASATLVDLVTERSGGNPFYIEELVTFVATRGVDLSSERAVSAVELPESLHSLILGRIDTVGEEERRTLKVASVVGRVFEAPLLPGAYPELGSLEDVGTHLAGLRAADLVNLDRAAEQAWLFKHVATQEVAYESLPFAVRAMLHGRIGRYLEETAGDGTDRILDLLAYHFWSSDDEARKREYLARAAAAAQASYANSAAIDYFERLLPLLPSVDRISAQLRFGQVLDLVGDWPRARAIADETRQAALELGDAGSEGWAHIAIAEIGRKQGRFDEAAGELEAAQRLFATVNDQRGLGQVAHLAGTVAAQRGDLDQAQRRYEESLAIRDRLGDRAKVAALYSNLAIVAEYSGDAAESRRMAERALTIRTEIGDRWGIGVSRNNLGAIAIGEGQLDQAKGHVEEALRIMEEVGDTSFASTARVLLANIDRDLGDIPGARKSYAASLATFVMMDDQVAIAELFEDIASLATRAGDHAEAIGLVDAAAALREAIGSPLPANMEKKLRERLAPSVSALGPAAAAAEAARGRSLDLGDAVALAAATCAETPSA